MAGNPQVPQGTLNRLVASVTWASYPQLNVTPSFLGRGAIEFSIQGETTRRIPTLTGVVQSPEPYQMIEVTINLLKTQLLAALYQTQMQQDALLGQGVVWPDVPVGTGIQPLDIINCAIQNVRPMAFSGEDAGFAVVLSGYWLVNQFLWS